MFGECQYFSRVCHRYEVCISLSRNCCNLQLYFVSGTNFTFERHFNIRLFGGIGRNKGDTGEKTGERMAVFLNKRLDLCAFLLILPSVDVKEVVA